MIVIDSINGTALAVQPLRDSYAVIVSDLLSEGSGRSVETGRAIRYLVRKDAYKLNLKFKGLPDEIAQVESLVTQFTQHVIFRYNGKIIETDMYPGDRTVTTNGFTSELSVNLIEI